MEKNFETVSILEENKEGSEYTCGDIREILKNTELLDTDKFYMWTDDEDDSYKVSIYRMVLETDEEFNARLEEAERIRKTYEKITEKQRYQQYLKLKEEFENN
jgi:hypothetical protein